MKTYDNVTYHVQREKVDIADWQTFCGNFLIQCETKQLEDITDWQLYLRWFISD